VQLTELLDKYDIDYTTSGKNIGRNYVGLPQCPSCGDCRNHFAVNTHTQWCSCFICQYKCHISNYISRVTKTPYSKVKEDFKGVNYTPQQEENTNTLVKYPHGFHEGLNQNCKNYLSNRGFDPEELTFKYRLMHSDWLHSLWKNRLIIPIFYNNKVVSYLGRTLYKGVDPRYKNANNDDVIIPVKQSLYGIDEVSRHAVLVEGITDKWKFGASAVATLGVGVTNSQINRLRKSGVTKISVLFDPDKAGEAAARKLSQKINLIVDCDFISWYILDGVDVGDKSEEQIIELRKSILGRMW
jgi:DNA primase